MKKHARAWARIATGLALVLALVVAAQLTRLASQTGLAPLELSARKIFALAPETTAFLDELGDETLLTYYVSPPSAFPSDMRHLREDVELVLDRFAQNSHGKVHFEVVVPEERPELRDYFTELGLASFRARTVEQDGWTESEVWSSLRIARGAREDTILHAITPDLVPGLQRLLVEQVRAAAAEDLEAAARRYEPRVTLAAAAGSAVELERLLRQSSSVTRVDFENAPEDLPADTDLFVWLGPMRVDEIHLRALSDYLATGRPALLALAPQTAQDSAATVEAAETLFAEFGVQVGLGQLHDEREGESPSTLRCIARDQDFRPLGGQPNGTLSFHGARVLRPDGPRLHELGRGAHALASTSSNARIVSSFAGSSLAGEPVRSPLLLLVDSDDPFQGDLLLAASSTPFSDSALRDDSSANRGLVQVLLDEFTAPERIVWNRASLVRTERLPPLSSNQRTLWRFLAVFLVPALCLLVALGRYAAGVLPAQRTGSRGRSLAPMARAVFALLVVMLLTRLAGTAHLRSDRTEGQLHTLSDAELRLWEKALETSETATLELFSNPSAELPYDLRLPMRRARDLCERLSQRIHGLRFETPPLENAPGEFPRAPRRLTSLGEGSTRFHRTLASLRIRLGQRSTVLSLDEAADHDHLRFRIAFAVWRLSRDREVRLAVAAPASRLSAAEDELDYRAEGLFAPTSGDRFSAARRLLERNDFTVTTVNPAAPGVDLQHDLLLWLQPRREIGRMLEVAARDLSRGGKVLLAAQHFEIAPRQLRRDDMQLSFWPRPLHCDLDLQYFPDLGVSLRREVFFDRESVPYELRTRVERRLDPQLSGQELERQFGSQPFVVRAHSARYGDLILPAPNRILASPARAVGFDQLQATPILFSSEHTWSYDWQGGSLAPELLEGRAVDQVPLSEAQPLATLFTGNFPHVESFHETQPDGSWRTRYVAVPPLQVAATPGQLLLVGCSAMFEDDALAEREFGNSLFLLDSVARLTLDDDLASIAARQPLHTGFERPTDEARVRWRLFVLGAGPLAGLILALCIFGIRRAC